MTGPSFFLYLEYTIVRLTEKQRRKRDLMRGREQKGGFTCSQEKAKYIFAFSTWFVETDIGCFKIDNYFIHMVAYQSYLMKWYKEKTI